MAKNKYEEFDTIRINLNRILDKVEDLFDVDYYRTEVKAIEDEINKEENIKSNKLPEIDFSKYISKLNQLTKEVNEEYLPYYEVHLLASRIKLTNDIDEDSYLDLKNKCTMLIDCLNKIPYSRKECQKKVLKEAYEALYLSICYESTIERNSILNCIIHANKASLNENIGLIIGNDLDLLDEQDRINIELSHRNEGLGSTYLSADTIAKLGEAKFGNKKSEYKVRKQTAAMEFYDKVSDYKEEKKGLDLTKENRLKVLKHSRLKRSGIILKRFSILAIIPIVCTALGVFVGSTIDSYYHVTKKTYDKETRIEIEEESSYYEMTKDDYKMVVSSYSPWRENPNGKGYIRDVEEWTYNSYDNNKTVDPDEVIKGMRDNKKSYTETKDVLHDGDSTIEPQIIVTEYITDRNDKSVNGGIMALFGTLIAVGSIAICSVYKSSYEYARDNDVLKEIKNDIKRLIKRKVIKESYVEIGNERVKLQEEIKDIENKYGDLASAVTEEQLDDIKRYVYKK